MSRVNVPVETLPSEQGLKLYPIPSFVHRFSSPVETLPSEQGLKHEGGGVWEPVWEPVETLPSEQGLKLV